MGTNLGWGGDKPWSKNGDKCRMAKFLPDGGPPPPPPPRGENPGWDVITCAAYLGTFANLRQSKFILLWEWMWNHLEFYVRQGKDSGYLYYRTKLSSAHLRLVISSADWSTCRLDLYKSADCRWISKTFVQYCYRNSATVCRLVPRPILQSTIFLQVFQRFTWLRYTSVTPLGSNEMCALF